MDYSQNSSISSNNYANFIATISSLRSDLERTTSKIKLLEDENLTLKNNYSTIKEELIDTRKKFNEVRENYLSAVTEKFDSERNQEIFVEKLKNQLSEKTKEFELLREKLIPHDIDQLRVKVQEELEVQHKQEIKIKQDEVEIQRSKFYEARREMERLKVEFGMLVQNQIQEISSLRVEKEELIDLMRKEHSENITVDQTTSKDDKIRTLNAKILELTHLMELNKEEIKRIKQDRDDATYNLEQLRIKSEQSANVLKAKLAILEAERAGFQERISRFDIECEKKETQVRNAKATNEDLSDRVDLAIKEKQEIENFLSITKTDNLAQLDALREINTQETRELNDHIDFLNAKLSEREEMIRKLQRETSEIQLRSESSECEIRRQYQLSLQEYKKKLTMLELELAENKQNLKLLEDQYTMTQEQTNLEKDSIVSELARIKRERDMLLTKLRDSDQSLDSQRRKYSSFNQEYYNKIFSLEKQLRECKAYTTTLEIKVESLSRTHLDTDKENQILKDSYRSLESKYNEILLTSNNLKSEFNQQLESLGPIIKEKTDEIRRQLKSAVVKEKKRGDAYKAKAMEVYSRSKMYPQA